MHSAWTWSTGIGRRNVDHVGPTGSGDQMGLDRYWRSPGARQVMTIKWASTGIGDHLGPDRQWWSPRATQTEAINWARLVVAITSAQASTNNHLWHLRPVMGYTLQGKAERSSWSYGTRCMDKQGSKDEQDTTTSVFSDSVTRWPGIKKNKFKFKSGKCEQSNQASESATLQCLASRSLLRNCWSGSAIVGTGFGSGTRGFGSRT
jgi:hypothetical protein